MHELNYKNPIKSTTLSGGMMDQKRGSGRLTTPIGGTTATAARTASGCSGNKLQARQPPPTPTSHAT